VYGFALRLINKAAYAPLGLWIFIQCFYIMAISIIFVGTNVMAFPFIAFGSGVVLVAPMLRHRFMNRHKTGS
jgi:hypothetical protein